MLFSYEMMIGVPPFYSQNQARMFHLIKKGKVMWPEPKDCKISDQARDLISKVTYPTHISPFVHIV